MVGEITCPRQGPWTLVDLTVVERHNDQVAHPPHEARDVRMAGATAMNERAGQTEAVSPRLTTRHRYVLARLGLVRYRPVGLPRPRTRFRLQPASRPPTYEEAR